MPNVHVLTLYGAQVSKKNKLRPRKGGYYYDARTRSMMDAYYWQARSIWRNANGPMAPLEKFSYSMSLYNQKADPDGIVTTVLDELVKAQVISDDAARNAVRASGPYSYRDNDAPRVVVTLESL